MLTEHLDCINWFSPHGPLGCVFVIPLYTWEPHAFGISGSLAVTCPSRVARPPGSLFTPVSCTQSGSYRLRCKYLFFSRLFPCRQQSRMYATCLSVSHRSPRQKMTESCLLETSAMAFEACSGPSTFFPDSLWPTQIQIVSLVLFVDDV